MAISNVRFRAIACRDLQHSPSFRFVRSRFLLDALHDGFGGWRIPMGVVLVALVPTLIAGLGAGRKRFVGTAA